MGRSLLYWLIVAIKQSMLSWKKKNWWYFTASPRKLSSLYLHPLNFSLAATCFDNGIYVNRMQTKVQWGRVRGLPPFCCWQPWDYHAKNPNLAFWRWGTTKREVPATVMTETFSQGLVLWVRPCKTTQPWVTQPKEFWTILNIDYFKPLTFRVVCYSAKDK